MDLVRKLLIKIEEVYEPGKSEISVSNLSIDGYDIKTINEHLLLMNDAELFQSLKAKTYVNGKTVISVGNLSNKGYDTLEEFRNDTVWNKTKEVVKEKGLPAVIDVFKDIASSVISSVTEGVIKSMK